MTRWGVKLCAPPHLIFLMERRSYRSKNDRQNPSNGKQNMECYWRRHLNINGRTGEGNTLTRIEVIECVSDASYMIYP